MSCVCVRMSAFERTHTLKLFTFFSRFWFVCSPSTYFPHYFVIFHFKLVSVFYPYCHTSWKLPSLFMWLCMYAVCFAIFMNLLWIKGMTGAPKTIPSQAHKGNNWETEIHWITNGQTAQIAYHRLQRKCCSM